MDCKEDGGAEGGPCAVVAVVDFHPACDDYRLHPPSPTLPFPLLQPTTEAASDTRRPLDRYFQRPNIIAMGLSLSVGRGIMRSGGREGGGSPLSLHVRVRGHRETVHCAARHRSDTNKQQQYTRRKQRHRKGRPSRTNSGWVSILYRTSESLHSQTKRMAALSRG